MTTIFRNPSVFKFRFKKSKISPPPNVGNRKFSISFKLCSRPSTGIQNRQLFPFLQVNSEKQDDIFFFNFYKPKYVFSPKIILII